MSLDLFFRGNLFTFLSRLAYKLGDFIYICSVQSLLNRMSAYSYTMNAQQQVETYRNVLRRYVMLNVT